MKSSPSQSVSGEGWLTWVKALRSIAQSGLTYAEGPYDLERYRQIQEIAAEIAAVQTGADFQMIRELFSGALGYETPKVDVRGVVFQCDKILLVKERSDGKWTLPGGWADVCTTPAENVVREVYEESGFKTRAVKVLAIYDRDIHPHVPPFPYHVYKIFFLCNVVGGSPQKGLETEKVDFFGESEIPELSMSRVTPEQITRMFEHYRDDQLPTDFD